ncbi:MAG TPA: uroporphyrinogen-III synthase [Methanocorpusculum sp.]|nr:uroporphyrinogen-III synthase [Methanocorpusculum sp.]
MKIAVTRLAGKEKDDEALFASYGHSVKIVSPLTAEINSRAVQQFVLEANDRNFDAVFFTSAYAAEHIAPLLDRNISKTCRVIGIGPKTTEVLHSYGIKAEMLTSYYSRDFAAYLGDWADGKRIGIPRADVPNKELMNSIEDIGAFAYEYRVYHLSPSGVPLSLDDCNAVLFTSSKSFSDAVLPDMSGIIPMAIGEITAETMKKAGVIPEVVGDGSMKGTLDVIQKKYL